MPRPCVTHQTNLAVPLYLRINALYALAWDIVMDWGMMKNPTAVIVHAPCVGGGVPPETIQTKSCGHALMRPRLRFGLLASAVILFIDAVLRFSWMLRFAQHAIFPSKDTFVLTTQFLEVFRYVSKCVVCSVASESWRSHLTSIILCKQSCHLELASSRVGIRKARSGAEIEFEDRAFRSRIFHRFSSSFSANGSDSSRACKGKDSHILATL